MSVAGTYECVTKTPMGDQKSDVTINVDGDTFTGTNAGAMGSLEMENGKVDGNKLTWGPSNDTTAAASISGVCASSPWMARSSRSLLEPACRSDM